MIQYTTSDGELGSITDSDNCTITIENGTFTITRRSYGWDEYDFWDDEITDVVELRIG